MSPRKPIAESPRKLAELLEGLEAAAYLHKYGGKPGFRPYIKQQAFFELGATKRERMLLGGNQTGKTSTGGCEVSYHMTGHYPDWWKGRRWNRPTRGWIAGETSLVVRDVQQRKLCGEPGVDAAFGTGLIPKDLFVDRPSLSRGITDAFDTIQVKHASGGVSVARFKSYEQGRQKFQGESLDWLWLDEEPPQEIYSEALTRTVATGGMVLVTFTPLRGPTGLVLRFTDEPSEDRAYVTLTIEEAEHISPAERERIVAGYLPHEREARAHGVPMLGSGRIFIVPEDVIREPQIESVPMFWKKLWGVDFGIDHPFAAVLILWDVDNDVIHVHDAFRMSGSLPVAHAQRMKPVAAGVPVSYPHDGNVRDKGSGEALSNLYKRQGLRMLPTHATFPDGSMSTEAGVLEWQEREETGRLKVAAHLEEWFEERRMYHRKDGQIVKLRDDMMSATRVAIMAKRFAKAVPLGRTAGRFTAEPRMAEGISFDLFTGA